MQKKHKVKIKLTFTKDTKRLVGAQIGSQGGPESAHTEAIFALSLAIQKQLTLKDLALMDVYFLPHFNKPFNFILTAVLKVLDIARF